MTSEEDKIEYVHCKTPLVYFVVLATFDHSIVTIIPYHLQIKYELTITQERQDSDIFKTFVTFSVVHFLNIENCFKRK